MSKRKICIITTLVMLILMLVIPMLRLFVSLSGLCMWFGCSIKGLKITSFILSGLMAVPAACFVLLFIILSMFPANTVVNTVVSPNGEYRAEVISSDQGALGGDTIVTVYSEKYIIEIRDTPERVYLDGWGAHEHMSIYWESDNVLIINRKDYEIIP